MWCLRGIGVEERKNSLDVFKVSTCPLLHIWNVLKVLLILIWFTCYVALWYMCACQQNDFGTSFFWEIFLWFGNVISDHPYLCISCRIGFESHLSYT